MKVCLVNDTSDDSNWGGRATSLALRELVESAGGHVDSTLYQYGFSTPQERDVEGNHKLRGVACSSESTMDVAPGYWGDFEKCAQDVLQGRIFSNIRKALDACDVVIISGEGCIYDRTRQSRMIFFIAYLARHFLGKKTALVNHSIVMNDPVLRQIARHVYPLLDDIVFREPDSALACPGISGKVAADAAYQLKPAACAPGRNASTGSVRLDDRSWNAEKFDPTRPYVCIGGGSVYFRGLRPGFDPIPGFVTLCHQLLDEVGQVLLTASSEKDLWIFEPISKELGLPLIGASVPVQQAVDVMGNARVYIGARWHPSIFAHTGGAPVIALEKHTPKMGAFAKQVGLSSRSYDPFSIETQVDDILKQVKKYIGEGEALRRELRAGAENLRSLSRQNVSILSY